MRCLCNSTGVHEHREKWNGSFAAWCGGHPDSADRRLFLLLVLQPPDPQSYCNIGLCVGGRSTNPGFAVLLEKAGNSTPVAPLRSPALWQTLFHSFGADRGRFCQQERADGITHIGLRFCRLSHKIDLSLLATACRVCFPAPGIGPVDRQTLPRGGVVVSARPVLQFGYNLHTESKSNR